MRKAGKPQQHKELLLELYEQPIWPSSVFFVKSLKMKNSYKSSKCPLLQVASIANNLRHPLKLKFLDLRKNNCDEEIPQKIMKKIKILIWSNAINSVCFHLYLDLVIRRRSTICARIHHVYTYPFFNTWILGDIQFLKGHNLFSSANMFINCPLCIL